MAISAAPLTREQEKHARETREAFNRAAAGHEMPGRASESRGQDKPQATHDIEPSLRDKKEGAERDLRSAERARNRDARTRDFDRSL